MMRVRSCYLSSAVSLGPAKSGAEPAGEFGRYRSILGGP